MSKPDKLMKGQAVREYLGVRDKVKALLDEGYDLSAIYRRLVGENLITMSYKALYYNQFGKKRRSRKTRAEAPSIQPQPASPSQSEEAQYNNQIRPQASSPAPARSGLRLVTPPEGAQGGTPSKGKLQALLEESQKAQQQYLTSVGSDPELKKEAERIVGK